MQAWIAGQTGGDYALSLALVAGTVAIVIAIPTALGHEAKGVTFGTGTADDALKRGPLGTVSPAV